LTKNEVQVDKERGTSQLVHFSINKMQFFDIIYFIS